MPTAAQPQEMLRMNGVPCQDLGQIPNRVEGATARFGVLDDDEAWGTDFLCVTVAVTRKLSSHEPFSPPNNSLGTALQREGVGRQESPTLQ